MNELIKSIDDAIMGVSRVAECLYDAVIGVIIGLVMLLVAIGINQINTGAVERPWMLDHQPAYTTWQHAAVQWTVPSRGGDAYTLRTQAELNE